MTARLGATTVRYIIIYCFKYRWPIKSNIASPNSNQVLTHAARAAVSNNMTQPESGSHFVRIANDSCATIFKMRCCMRDKSPNRHR